MDELNLPVPIEHHKAEVSSQKKLQGAKLGREQDAERHVCISRHDSNERARLFVRSQTIITEDGVEYKALLLLFLQLLMVFCMFQAHEEGLPGECGWIC